MRRILLAVILPFLMAIMTGCYAGVAAVVVGVVALSGGGGSGGSDSPPVIAFARAPYRTDGGRVLVDYEISDDSSGDVNVGVWWRALAAEGAPLPLPEPGEPAGPGGDGFLPAASFSGEVRVDPLDPGSEMASSDPLTVAVRARESQRLRIIWDAPADLEGSPWKLKTSRVEIRIQARAARRVSLPRTTEEALFAGNERPQATDLHGVGADSGFIPFEVNLCDSTADQVRLTGAFRVGDSGEERAMTILGGPIFDAACEEDGGGRALIVWNSRADFDRQASADVRVRITPWDIYDPELPGTPAELAGIPVINNEAPRVEVVDPAPAPDLSFDVPIPVIIRDREGDAVDVILQWTPEGKGFPALPDDPASLREILSGPDDALRRRFQVIAGAPVRLAGRLDDSRDLPPDQVRLGGLVRAGLAFRPPDITGPRPLGGAKAGAGTDAFLIGKEIVFRDPGSERSAARRIVAVDFGCSIATLDEALEPPFPPGAAYDLEGAGGAGGLSSAPAGLLHRVRWSSLDDLKDAGYDLDSEVRFQARGVDAQGRAGEASTPRSLRPRNRLFVQLTALAGLPDPSAVAAGDLTGDGLPDIAAASVEAGKIQVFPQARDGSFSSTDPQLLDAGPGEIFLSIGDFNGDGRADLAAASSGSERLKIFLQDAQGRLLESAFPPFTGPGSSAIASGDVDGDERDDLVAANTETDTLNVYLQRGGSLQAIPSYSLASGGDPAAVAIGRIDGDSLNDAAAANSGSDTVTIFLQRGGALQSPGTTLNTGSRPISVAIGRLAGDPGSDLVVANAGFSTLSLFIQEGGTFRPIPRTLFTGTAPAAVAAGDLDRDGLEDILVLNSGSATAGIYLQSALRELIADASAVVPLDPAPNVMALGDLDRDGRGDLVAASQEGTVAVWMQSGPGDLPLEPTQVLGVPGKPDEAAVGDLNADGRPDVVAAGKTSGSLEIFFQAIDGSFPAAPDRSLAAGAAAAVALGDLDADGRLDIATAIRSQSEIRIFHQGSPGEFPQDRLLVIPTGANVFPEVIAIGDIDGDGRDDLLAAVVDAAALAGRIFIYQQDRCADPNSSPGGLAPVPTQVLQAGIEPAALAIGDLDGDGRKDLAAIHRLSSEVLIFIQNGATQAPLSPAGSIPIEGPFPFPESVAIGDLNGDGLPDLAVAKRLPDTVCIYLQDSATGEFPPSPARVLETGQDPVWVVIADGNGDGRNDVLVVNESAGAFGIYLQDAGGSLPVFPNRTVRTGNFPRSLSAADLNGDGRPDAVVANREDRTLNVYLAR